MRVRHPTQVTIHLGQQAHSARAAQPHRCFFTGRDVRTARADAPRFPGVAQRRAETGRLAEDFNMRLGWPGHGAAPVCADDPLAPAFVEGQPTRGGLLQLPGGSLSVSVFWVGARDRMRPVLGRSSPRVATMDEGAVTRPGGFGGSFWPVLCYRGTKVHPAVAFEAGLRHPGPAPVDIRGLDAAEVRRAAEDHAHELGPDGAPLDRVFYANAALALTKYERNARLYAQGLCKCDGWVYEIDMVRLVYRAPSIGLAFTDTNLLVPSTHWSWESEIGAWGPGIPRDCLVRAIAVDGRPPQVRDYRGKRTQEVEYAQPVRIWINPGYRFSTPPGSALSA